MAVRPEAALPPTDLTLLGGNFPPGLNTATPDFDIAVDETPDGYGFSLTTDGVIAKNGTIPTVSSRILKAVTISSVPYSWAYRRLWNITNKTAATASTILTFGAEDYEDIYVPQRSGKIYFDESATTLLTIQPFGQDSMFVAKTDGGYVLSNLSDTRAFWTKSDIIQEMITGAATGVIELNGVVYCSSASGLFALDRGNAVEITRKVRDDLTNFGSVALTADYKKGYIKGGSSYIYEVATQKLFRWSSTNFLYTTRQAHMRDWTPFSVDNLLFTVSHTDENHGTFDWQVKIEDAPWSSEETAVVDYGEDEFTQFKLFMDGDLDRSCRKFQFRMTDLSSNLQIKEIRMDSKEFQQDDYAQ